ncbi:MAG: class I SAM-dependent methyltransferase [Minisyncoccia bacterium]
MVIIQKKDKKNRWKEAQDAELNFWNSLALNEVEEERWKKYLLSGINTKNKTIIDVGCGPRGVVHYITDAKEKIGLDPLINLYSKKYTLDSNTKFINATAEAIPLEDDYVDIVFCINVLDHIEDPELGLREMHRILKNDGELNFLINTYSKPFLIIEKILEIFGIWEDKPHPHHFTFVQISKILGRYFIIENFKCVRNLSYMKTFYFKCRKKQK